MISMPTSSLSLALAVSAVTVSVVAAQEAFPEPGPQHELLKQMTGDWNAKMTCNFPGTEGPIETSGTYSAKLDVGGFFLIGEFKSEFFGQPFQGHSITGYNQFEKKYKGVWVDSMGPFLYHTEAEFSQDGKTYKETMTGPGPDGKPMKFRSVIDIKDDDHMQMTMFIVGEEGKEQKMMEIEYTRKD